ncbi:sialin-like [Biomphalaria glabrata]|uniref:Sialin-like n=1 Tax=Biomphalaria glabrata TaxID=6526 RepID=A0A9W2YAQ6_BIOGL|nr:sialin-like [Biomphalaria glabrata]
MPVDMTSVDSPPGGGKKVPLFKTPSTERADVGSPKRPPLETQQSTASMKRRSYSRRASSSFDFAHIDSVQSCPSLKLEEIDLSKVPWWTSHRFWLAVLNFFGFVVLYAQRVNLSIAIVSMVSHTHTKANSSLYMNLSTTHSYLNTTKAPNLPEDKCPKLEAKETKAEFHWSKELEGLILGAFFWGYLVLQVPGGRMSEKIGAKKVVAFAMFPVAILTLLSPIAARTDPYFFMVVRGLIGLGEGVMYPAAQAFWANWAPPNERSRLIGFSYAGGQFGNAIIFPIAGYLCAYGFDGGWPSVFYIIGAAGFIWCVLWVIFANDTPDQDKSISDIEKKYIKYSIGERQKGKKIGKNIPWKSIFTSGPVWGILVAHACGNYGAYMLLTKLPAFMKEVLKFDIKSNGVFSMLPYLLFWFLITVSGMIADCLISRDILSIANTRKLMATIGMVGPAAFLVGAGFMECHQQAETVVLITLAVGLCGFHFSGYFINHGDIAPPYAGTLFGISNTLATVPGIISPYIVSAMTKNGTKEEWRSTFYVAAGIYLFGNIWYIIFGRGEIQPWAGGEVKGEVEGVGFGLHEIQEAVKEEEEDEDDDKKKGLLNDKEGSPNAKVMKPPSTTM